MRKWTCVDRKCRPIAPLCTLISLVVVCVRDPLLRIFNFFFFFSETYKNLFKVLFDILIENELLFSYSISKNFDYNKLKTLIFHDSKPTKFLKLQYYFKLKAI